MLDGLLRPMIDKPLNRAARFLARHGVGANALTLSGFLCGLGAFICLACAAYGLAALLILFSRLLDGLDGPVARQTKPTDLGGFYDIVADFVFYAGAVFFFALGRPDSALAAAFLIFSFMGTASSFLAYAIFAMKHGLPATRQGQKSFFYAPGLAEGTETIAALILMCVFPGRFDLIAWIYGAMCWQTTLARVLRARAELKGR